MPVFRHRKSYWAGLLFCFLGPTATAQKAWTLTECLAFAQSNNLQVQQAGLAQNKSVLQLNAARNLVLPTVDARMRTAGNWGFIIDPSTNELSNQFNFGNQAALNLNLSLFNGFANSYQVKLRRQQVSAAGYGYQMSSNAVSLDVLYAFLQVVLGQEQLHNSRQRTAQLEKQHKGVKVRVERGALSKRDLLNLQSQLAAEDLLAVYAENSVEKALFGLKQAMGLAATEAMSVKTVEIPADWLTPDLTIDDVLAAATTALPDLKAAQASIEASYYTWQLERASYKTGLSLNAQLATRTSNYKTESFGSQAKNNLNRQVGLSLYVPVFNRFQLRSTDQLAKVDLQAAKLGYQQVERELRAKVTAAFLDYRAAARKYQALQLQYSAVEEEYRYAEKMLELGGIDALDYSATRSRMITAQSELVQAKYDCFFKQKTLDFYQGKPLVAL